MIPNQWYAILPSQAVKPGQVIGVRRLGMDLAIFRSDKGALGCVVDQCTHRGAALSKGRVVGGCVRCPFHGIRFDTNGRCTLVPANGRAQVANLSRFDVQSLPVREGNGIVYLWYGDPDKRTDDLPFFSSDVDSTWVYSEMEDPWDAHYSRCIENQLDVVHLPFVHWNTIGRGNKTLVDGPKVELVDGGLITSASNEVDVGQAPKPASECAIKPTYLSFRFPNLWMNHVSDTVKIMIYFAPVDDEHTILYIRFYSKITGLKPVDAVIAQLGKVANGVVERQDKRVVITQRPKASSYRSGEKLLAGDAPIVQYRRIRDELKSSQQ